MHQQKFDEVRDLIDQQRYDEARVLLASIDHPLALKWLDRVDEADPRAASREERARRRVSARKTHLKTWMKQERIIARWTGLALFVFAFYLWQFETVFWTFSPDIMVQLLPALVFGAGIYVIWNVHSNARLRRQLLRMDAGELRKVSAVLLPSAGLLLLLTLVTGNVAQFFAAGFLVVIGMLNVWRATRAEKLSQRRVRIEG